MLTNISESLPQLVESSLFKKGINFYPSSTNPKDLCRNPRSYAPSTTQIYETWHLVKDRGLVYIINVGADYYKIGVTTDLRQRFMAFQTSNPFVINSNQLVAAIEAPDPFSHQNTCTSKAYELESWVHKLLRDKRHRNSEMFKLSQEDIQDLFEKIQKNSDLGKVYWGTQYKYQRKHKDRVVGTMLPRRIVRGLLRAVPYKSRTKKYRVNPMLKRVSECQLTKDAL